MILKINKLNNIAKELDRDESEFKAYQYLQSKGYKLPINTKEDKTAVEFSIVEEIVRNSQQRASELQDNWQKSEAKIASLQTQASEKNEQFEVYKEVFDEMVGLFSKQYDSEETGIYFKQQMRFLINKHPKPSIFIIEGEKDCLCDCGYMADNNGICTQCMLPKPKTP